MKKPTQTDQTAIDRNLLLAADLRWECRYSHDDQPDKMGRWARKCFFKDHHIAWVNRLEFNGTIRFCVNTQFPVNGNDMPHFCSHFETFKEAKECVDFFWRRFLLVCR